METLATRVTGLVRRFFDGSVNGAAKAWGVPQRTLARLVAGELAHPRADVVAAIARGVGASIEWVLTGRGDEPPSTSPVGDPIRPEWVFWRGITARLAVAGLDLQVLGPLFYAPFAARWAFIRIAEKLGSEVSPELVRVVQASSMFEVTAWANLLDGFVKEFGDEAVARALNQLRSETMLGFNGLAIYLNGEGKLTVEVDAEYRNYEHSELPKLALRDMRGVHRNSASAESESPSAQRRERQPSAKRADRTRKR